MSAPPPVLPHFPSPPPPPSTAEPLLLHYSREGSAEFGAQVRESSLWSDAALQEAGGDSGGEREEGERTGGEGDVVIMECRFCREEYVGLSRDAEEAEGDEGEGEGERGERGGVEIEKGERLVQPCECGGTMARIHLKCLQRWIERRRMDSTDSDALRCEVCRTPYRLRVHEKLDLTWMRLCSYASISFYAEFCTICATLASMVFLFFLIASGNQREPMGNVGFYTSVAVAVAVFSLGIFTLVKVVSRWRQVISIPLLSPQPSLSRDSSMMILMPLE